MMIRTGVLVLLLLWGARPGLAADIPVPWEEFRQLYRESIEREVRKLLPPKVVVPMYNLQESVCRLKLTSRMAEVDIKLAGTVIAGQVEAIALLEQAVHLHAVHAIEGGHLVHGGSQGNLLSFRPDSTGPFHLHFSFLLPVEADRHARSVTFPIPRALKNSLHIEKAEGLNLLHVPGIRGSDGSHYFTARKAVTVRFGDARMAEQARKPMIDMLSSISIKGRRVKIRSVFLPVEPVSAPLLIEVPKALRYAAASLGPHAVRERADQRIEVRLPQGHRKAFHIDFIGPRATEDQAVTFDLPRVEANEGTEGRFVLHSSGDAVLELERPGQFHPTTASRLPSGLLGETAGATTVFRSPDRSPVMVKSVFFAKVETPALVLDRLSFFTSVEENGNCLSMMAMDIPAGTGEHLAIASVPDADIWYLRVNGRPRTVYSDDKQNWLVPLPAGEAAHVELAFHRKLPRLGLHGRLDAILPAFGMPCREVAIGIALPERIRLVSFEGAAAPDPQLSPEAPPEFVGRPLFFKRTFYRGEGMAFSMTYEEPVRHPSAAN